MARIDLSAQLADVRARVAAETNGDPEVEGPMYAQLEKKTTLIREEQYVELTALARFLMKRRRTRGERITENTLIRVAIDLLFTHRDHLDGSTETELRNSVTSELANSPVVEVRKSMSGAVPESGSAERWNGAGSELPNSGSPEASHSEGMPARKSGSSDPARSLSSERSRSGTEPAWLASASIVADAVRDRIGGLR